MRENEAEMCLRLFTYLSLSLGYKVYDIRQLCFMGFWIFSIGEIDLYLSYTYDECTFSI
jgi:hypothetical protein